MVCSETKIDRICDRLDDIENFLGCHSNVMDNLSHSYSNDQSQTQAISPEGPEGSPLGLFKAPTYCPTLGEHHDATTGSHLVLASKAIEEAVESSPSAREDFELRTARDALESILDKEAATPDFSDLSLRPQDSWPEVFGNEPSPVEIIGILENAGGMFRSSFQCRALTPWP